MRSALMRHGVVALCVLAVWLASASLALADDADDVGNNALAAAAITPDAGALSRVVNADIDEDWYSFVAMPSVVYSVSVGLVTVWGNEFSLIAPDGETGLYVTNTAAGGAPTTLVWTNSGALATCYVRVDGMVEYTTGIYQVAVSRLNYADTDSDGMLDSWEILHFGLLTNGASGDVDQDALSNLQEYILGTLPTNASSGLFVVQLDRTTNSTTVTWPSVRNGSYRVQTSTNLGADMTWISVSTNRDIAGSSSMEFVDTTGLSSTSRFYRIEFFH